MALIVSLSVTDSTSSRSVDTKSQEQNPSKPAQAVPETPRPSQVTAGQTPGLSYGQSFNQPR